MILFLMTAVVILVLIYFVRRDRRYESKTTKEVVTPEMKRFLNIKTEDDDFISKLDERPRERQASKDLLKSMNKSDFND